MIHFHFDSPSFLWGTVAEWAMVVFAAASALALIWTLWEQRKINKQIVEKGRREIRPYFKVKYVDEETIEGVRIPEHFQVFLNDAPALNVKWQTLIDIPYLKENLPESIRLWDLHHYGISLPSLLPNRFASHNYIEVYKVYFEDEEGRNYTQNISVEHGELFTTFPKLIKNI